MNNDCLRVISLVSGRIQTRSYSVRIVLHKGAEVDPRQILCVGVTSGSYKQNIFLYLQYSLSFTAREDTRPHVPTDT